MNSRWPAWKRYTGSGLVVLIPIVVTGAVLLWLYRQAASFAVFESVGPPWLQVSIILVGFATIVVGLGMLMRTTSGSFFETRIDAAMNRLPGLRIIYNASKMASETVFTDSEQLQTPVTLEMWSGTSLTGFKTGKRTADGRELVFVPTAPNPTSGFVVEVDPADVTENDETVEDALARILSCGFGEVDSGSRSQDRLNPRHGD